MAKCDECGEFENLPYQCRRCGNTFCAEHRLPENHDCPGLLEWNDPSGVFGEANDSTQNRRSRSDEGLLGRASSTGGPLGYFKGNVAYLFLGLMWITFGLQLLLQFGLDMNRLVRTLFYLSSQNPLYVWTWFTSIFAHGGFYHIVGNSIALFFFGPLVEEYVGSRKFTALFLISGALAGLATIGMNIVLSPTSPMAVVGASGAIMAVLGVLTVLKPKMRILIFFPIPIPLPLWIFTIGFSLISVLFFVNQSAAAAAGQGNVAHLAHLIGLVIGLAYGERVKGRRQIPDRLQLGGGRRGGRGPF